MKIYIAATFEDQKAIRDEASKLWEAGHHVTGTWVHEVSRPSGMDTDTFKRKLAIKDVAEVMMADVIILDNRRTSGGKNCEWGIALGQFQNKTLYLIGEPSNVFHYLADKRFKSWEECHEWLLKTVV